MHSIYSLTLNNSISVKLFIVIFSFYNLQWTITFIKDMNIWLSSISHLPFPPFVNLDFSCIPAHSKINCGILMSLKASHYTTYSCTMLVQIVEPANRIQHCIISTSQGMYFKIKMNQKTKQSTFFFRDLRLAVQIEKGGGVIDCRRSGMNQL